MEQAAIIARERAQISAKRIGMIAEIAHLSQALVAALTEADALVKAGSFGPELSEVVRHAREVGDMLRDAVQQAEDAVDDRTREMVATLAAAVESLAKQVQASV